MIDVNYMFCWKACRMIEISQNFICLFIYLFIYLFINLFICTFVMKNLLDFDLCINVFSREQIFKRAKKRKMRHKQQSNSRFRFILYFFFFFFFFSFFIDDWNHLFEKWMFQSINNFLSNIMSNNISTICSISSNRIYSILFDVSFSMFSHWMKN